jgi:hypothetical protein
MLLVRCGDALMQYDNAPVPAAHNVVLIDDMMPGHGPISFPADF